MDVGENKKLCHPLHKMGCFLMTSHDEASITSALMPTEPPSNLNFEIGHALFIDIVGYSKLLITDQSELLQKLKQIVWATEQFRLAQVEGKLLRLPTGDGGGFGFPTTRKRRCSVRWRSAKS